MFSALDTAVSGVNVHGTWMDAIADNVANINTINPADQEPFRAELVELQATKDGGQVGSGVTVKSIQRKAGDPDMTFDPENPLADANGYVKHPVVDLSEEMTNMMIATRAYQANLNVMDKVRDAYLQALQIGK
ncbi:MAG TPA: flagellar basal body rod protein FlgC [Acidimicrobiales bacterium]|nr:flagellar basal body rod protein FlgC [Acidimicrobiales bacterium]